jgi:cell division septal protein FtsQ
VVAALAFAVLSSPLADVDHIAVEGAHHLDARTVAEASGVRRGAAMYAVDASTATRRLLRLPWVERAWVAVRWPDTVEMKVVERPVWATVVVGERRYVVGRGGMVVERALQRADADDNSGQWDPEVKLPERTKVEVGERLRPGLAAAVEMIAALPSSVRPWITAAEIDEHGDVDIVVGIVTKVHLGPPEDAAAKFRSLEAMLSGSVVLDCMTELDVRVPGDPRVRRAPGC